MAIIANIVPLPCGCFVDPQQLRVIGLIRGKFVLCPWCETAFGVVELSIWWDQDSEFLPVSASPKVLIAVNSQLLEVMYTCDGCGDLVTRHRGERDVFHLKTKSNQFTVLRN